MIHSLTADPPQTQPVPSVGVQALVDTLQTALDQTHDLWEHTQAGSAAAAQLCAIDRRLQQSLWDATHLITTPECSCLHPLVCSCGAYPPMPPLPYRIVAIDDERMVTDEMLED